MRFSSECFNIISNLIISVEKDVRLKWLRSKLLVALFRFNLLGASERIVLFGNDVPNVQEMHKLSESPLRNSLSFCRKRETKFYDFFRV